MNQAPESIGTSTKTLPEGGAHNSELATWASRLRLSWRGSPRSIVFFTLITLGLLLGFFQGWTDLFQQTVFGLATGSIYALAAGGLTLVFGVLKLANFAHGELLTFAAFSGYVGNVVFNWPLLIAAMFAIVVTCIFAVITEFAVWAPMRRKGAGVFQMVLMSIGLMFVIHYAIQFFSGPGLRTLNIDRGEVYYLLGVPIGKVEIWAIVTGLVSILIAGFVLRTTLIGKRMRAVSDSSTLASVAGIDVGRVIIYVWVFAGLTAGMAGVIAGSMIAIEPGLGFGLILPIFAAVIMGGTGDVFGALLAGILLGVVTEWSTLVIDHQYKLVVGFALMITVMLLSPQGIVGRAKVL